MAKRGRPKGSLNKKTLKKLDQSSNGIKETDLSTTQKKVLDGPDIVAPQSETKGKIEVKTRTVADLPRTPSIIEILTLVEETEGDDAKVDILKQFTDRNDVKYAFKAAFDSRVVFTLPDGLPDGFVVGDADTPEGAMDMAPERFIRVYKRMQYWVEGGRAQAKQSKKEEIFLDTLRSLEKSEAEFLLAIKNKTMPYKSVTKEICEKAGFDLSPK